MQHSYSAVQSPCVGWDLHPQIHSSLRPQKQKCVTVSLLALYTSDIFSHVTFDGSSAETAYTGTQRSLTWIVSELMACSARGPMSLALIAHDS